MTSIGAGLGWSSSSATTAKNPSLPTRVCRTTQLYMMGKPPANYVARWRRPEAIWPDTWKPITAAWTTIPVLSNHVPRIYLHDLEALPDPPSAAGYWNYDFAGAGFHSRGAYEKQGLFQCAQCDKRFESPKSLSNHQAVHDGKTTCNLCGKVESTRSNLNRHMKITHPESVIM